MPAAHFPSMTPRLRAILLATLVSAFALWTAADIADESYLLASCAGCAVVWLLIEWLGGAFPDAWLLGAVVAGYVIGNRGFAQFSPTTRLPLLPAEVALAASGAALVVRAALRRTAAVRRDLLDYSLLAWIALGLARMPLDVRRFGALAIRDFAMVYYAGFFFVAQSLGSHEASARLLRRAFTAAFATLPIVSVANRLAPGAVQSLTWHGIPLIFHKSDITAAGLGAGTFWFWALYESTGRRRWLIPAAASIPLLVTLDSPRAAMVAVAVVTLAWLAARRWRLALFQAGVGAAAFAAAVAFVFWSGRSIRETASYATYERVVSIIDWSGTGSYTNPESASVGDNNRFRVVWWGAVARETLDGGPWFGLGFGADLASQFLVEYELIEAQDFTARSPHSMIMSVFGRMGAAGIVLWLLVTAGMARQSFRAFTRRDYYAMGLWSVSWVYWISGCFGIVLEGPMGAVVFWTATGLAASGLPIAREAALKTEAS